MRWRRQLSWSPERREWRVAALFMVGASLFGVASLPLYQRPVPGNVVAVTFVVGALFFTAAAYNQLRLAHGGSQLLWWAAIVQLAGTLLFNVSTTAALLDALDTAEENRLVWAPDMAGSVAFITASHLAWRDFCGLNWCVRAADEGWWVAILNYLGSIFFLIAAVASLTLPTTGETLNIAMVNTGTFFGAIGFFLAAYLLLPARDAS